MSRIIKSKVMSGTILTCTNCGRQFDKSNAVWPSSAKGGLGFKINLSGKIYCSQRCKREDEGAYQNHPSSNSDENSNQSSNDQSKGKDSGLGFLGGALAGAGVGVSSILGGIGKGISNMNNKEEQKAEEISSMMISSDKDELEQQITFLISTGRSATSSIIKQPCIEKAEFALMKYKKFGQSPELEHFEQQLKKLKSFWG